MSKANKVTHTKIQKLLKDQALDPKLHSSLALIIDMADPIYCEQRAIELLQENRILNTTERINSNRALAISLIATAVLLRNS
jgi:hypothetical protein